MLEGGRKKNMDNIDKQLITLIQAGFPLTERPWAAIGDELGIGEEEVINRISAIYESGEIRRIGASFDSRHLGYASTLCAVHIPGGKLEEAIAVINAYHNVTHNYERNHHYNVWFTLIAPSRARIREILAEIEGDAGVGPILNLPANRLFKIQVDLPVIDD
jgi:DNA-binding Lrp family transcriptional regulator